MGLTYKTKLLMKTLEQLKELTSKCLDGRDFNRLAKFVPYSMINETDNIRPFLSIRIRGKDEIIPFKDKKEIQSVKAHLCSIFSGFVKIGDWYLKMSEVKEYKPVTAEDMNPYILFKTSKFGNIKVRFPKDEDMNAELLVLDQLFDVE